MLFGDVKRQIKVVQRIVARETTEKITFSSIHTHYPSHAPVVEQFRTMTMDERAEGETVLPARVEILHVDVLVRRRFALTPQQKTIARRHLLNRDVLQRLFVA